MHTLYLDGAAVLEIINKIGLDAVMDKIIKSVEESFVLFEENEIETPPRFGLYTKSGLVEFMPAKMQGAGVCTKIVNYHAGNYKQGLPSVMATVVMINGETGFPEVIADATLLTAMRTGAASAVATKYLARKDAEVVGIIGTGAQAVSQLHALSRVLEIKEAIVYDRVIQRADEFAEKMSKLFKIRVRVSSPKETCKNAQVITTCTNVKRTEPPVIEDAWVRAGTHINAVGSDDPGKGELDPRLLRRAKVVPDFWKQARTSGECQGLLGPEIHAELGEIITGKKPGRESASEITVFDSTGTAFEDLVVFQELVKLAKNLGLGSEQAFMLKTKQPYNPYSTFV